MKSYFALSFTAHGVFIAFLILAGTLLAKPRMAYYSVDLFSLPAGAPGGGAAPSVSVPEEPAKPAAQPEEFQKAAPQPKAPPKEAIRLPGKVKKKTPPKPAPVAKPKPSAHFEAAMRALGREENGNASGAGTSGAFGAPGGSDGRGSGIVAEAGASFPYPWYLKALSDRLDKQWRPPQEFQSDTVCQIAFTVHRDGHLSDSRIERPSGDSFFDQLALRAVLYANPLPPLPNGYPEQTLRVHMKFDGKRL